jgi:peptide/nickel transport system substrate-binding protein
MSSSSIHHLPALSRRGLLGVGIATGSAALLAACGGQDTTGQTTAGATGGTLKWGWALPTSWDPVTSSAGWDVHVLSLVYAGLTKLDRTGTAVPALASSWKYNSDGTAVTFTLRPGLKFSDGTALDAAAVKASLERGRDYPKSLVAAQLVNVKTVTASDPVTLTIQLSTPDFQIPNLLAGKTGMVVSPAAFTRDATSLATRPVGAGPFTLTSYTQNAKAVLARNPDYWDAANIKLRGFEAYPLPDSATVVAALESGQYDVAQIPGSQVPAAKAAGLEVQVIPSLVVAVLDVNITKKPFDDPKVALALKYAVDRAALRKTAQFGYGDVTYQPFPKGYPGFNATLDSVYAYDPDQARQLLKESSYGGKPVPVAITTSTAEGVPEQLQAQLQAVGFTATIEVIPQAQATQIIYIQHSRALAVDQFAGRDSAVQAFQVLFGSQGLMNPGRTTPPTLQAALDKVRKTPLDDPGYPQALQAAAAVAVQNMPNVFLYTVPRILARRPAVSPIPEFTVVQRFEGVTVT